MRINCDFLNGTTYWQNKVLASARRGGEILSNPGFLDVIEAHTGFDFCNMPPRAVRDKIEHIESIMIKVGFYRGWWWSKAIAFEENGEVWFNTRKEAYGAGGLNNVIHETMHALGFSHNGNSAIGNENTVPYWIGNKAAEWARVQK